MLEMLCALPTPCGGEEISKKYIMQKNAKFQEDEFGNLVAHYAHAGQRVMIYTALDEDAAIVMDVQDDKVFFAHLGKRKIYPSMTVSFGGFTGVVCADGDNPSENQYIRMLDGTEGIEVGRIGVFDGEFEGDTEDENGILFGKNIAFRTAVSALMQDFSDSPYDLYVVLGVQSNHRNKGLMAAVQTIRPAKMLILEETTRKKLTLKLLASDYSCMPEAEAEMTSVFNCADISFEKSVDDKEKSAGSCGVWSGCAVVGIPVRFSDYIRQAIHTKTVQQTERLVKFYAEGRNE